jgi:hypothetical protein
MGKKRERQHGTGNQQKTIVQAALISAALGLLGGLLSNVVANLINVPDGWEWLPVAALTIVFLVSLPVTIWLARNSKKEVGVRGLGRKDGVTIERVELVNSKIRDIHSNGQVTVKDAELSDSEISDIEAR